ncbi:hypothetical protein BLOT_007047 [Blomia tropicalis]|nr:hypothetical protein BLOT_007047 [Blomia tropicalis]
MIINPPLPKTTQHHTVPPCVLLNIVTRMHNCHIVIIVVLPHLMFSEIFLINSYNGWQSLAVGKQHHPKCKYELLPDLDYRFEKTIFVDSY